jgi:5'-nucleotidase
MAALTVPRVLVSNDDGINAPGLRALVQKLAAAQICHVYVMAPSGRWHAMDDPWSSIRSSRKISQAASPAAAAAAAAS